MAIELPGGEANHPKVMAKWGSLNTQVDRAAIPEDDFSHLENFIPIAPGDLRALYAEGSTVYTTAPRTIISMFPYNFGATAYVALFLDDGSAVQIKASDGSSVTIGTAGTFYSGGAIPACSQYQSKYLIIGSDVSANAYWVWDGTALFGAGGIAPQVTLTSGGNNYSSPPTITAYGGSGSGATFSSTVANNQVVSVVCTNPGSGYLLNDQPILAFSGGGSDASAVALPHVATCSGVSAVFVTLGGKFSTQTASVAIAAPPSGTTVVVHYDVVGGVPTNLTVFTTGTAYWTGAPITFALNTNYVSGTHSTATITPNADGTVTAAVLTNSGGVYTNGTGLSQTGTAPAAGVTATAIATCTADGSGTFYVSAITVTNSGYGYTVPPTVTITGGGSVSTVPTALSNITKGVITSVVIQSGGSGYNGNPAVIFSGANDPEAVITQSAVGVATISAGAVTGVTMTTYGYGYLTASARLSGGNNAASALVTLMPFGVQATAIETYNNQVWTSANPATGPKMSFTAPNSVSDFATFDGGGSAPATDSFLRRALTGMKQNSTALYRFGDSSVNAITNVQTASTGVTTYNNSNVDSQIGTPWRDTICSFDRAVVFANSTGVYALFGGAVQKVSDQLDGLFEKASFNTGQAGVTPTATVCTLYTVRCYCLLFTTTDQYSGTLRNILACWNGQRWFLATQLKTLTLVALQELDSVFTSWGTDGTRLFKLFQTPSSSLTKVFQTRLDGASLPDATDRVDEIYVIGNVTSGGSTMLTVSVDTERGPGPPITFNFPAARQVVPSLPTPQGANYGVLRGLTGVTTAQDMQVIAIERLEHEHSRMYAGVGQVLTTEAGDVLLTEAGETIVLS